MPTNYGHVPMMVMVIPEAYRWGKYGEHGMLSVTDNVFKNTVEIGQVFYHSVVVIERS